MKPASRFAATLALALLASTSRAALVDVGNGLINHPAANLTWVADANLFLTLATADAGLVGKVVAAWTDGAIPTLAGDGSTHTIVAADFNATTGKMNWYGARAWVNYLRVALQGLLGLAPAGSRRRQFADRRVRRLRSR